MRQAQPSAANPALSGTTSGITPRLAATPCAPTPAVGMLRQQAGAAAALSRQLPARSSRWLFGLLAACLSLALTACGFHLKGVSALPFDTLYTNISADTEFGAQLRRAIRATSPSTRLVDTPEGADARLTQLANNQSLRDISIDARGRVEEYELNLDFTFQLTDAKGNFLLQPVTLHATREMPYDPDAVQAKEGEIASIFRNMQQALIDRIIRRLTAPEVTQAYHDAAAQPRDPAEATLSVEGAAPPASAQ